MNVMNNRIYEAAVSLALGKVEAGQEVTQAIADTLWLLRHHLSDAEIHELYDRLKDILIGS